MIDLFRTEIAKVDAKSQLGWNERDMNGRAQWKRDLQTGLIAEYDVTN